MIAGFIEILIEFGLVFTLFAGFCFIGRWFLKGWGSAEAILKPSTNLVFNHFVLGLLVAVTLYSIVFAKGVTLNILLVPLLILLLKKKDRVEAVNNSKNTYHFSFTELAFIALISICVLHLFPESEYKQADAFFYLKISESLNTTGQENLSHYYNNLNPIFHGVEPYHYFELWITSFIIRITESFFSSILVERFVTHGILMTGIIAGFYDLLQQIFIRKILAVEKLFCWSLVFFRPICLIFFLLYTKFL